MNPGKNSIQFVCVTAIFAAITFSIACNSDKNSGAVSNSAIDTSAKVAAAPDTSKNIHKSKGMASVTKPTTPATTKMTEDKNGIYYRAEVMPSFPGGETALESYIQNNIQYPTNALNNNIQGSTVVQFAIDTNGKVFQATELTNKLGYGLDGEALRVVSTMPDWTPGTMHGKKVRTYVEIPIAFTIQQENEGVH